MPRKGERMTPEQLTRHRARMQAQGPRQRGPNNPNWKGGRVKLIDGRIGVYAPGHPEATLCGGIYALEYRLVATEMIGRPLRADEVVHHVNGDPTDNRPDNLEVMTDEQHKALHANQIARRDPSTGQFQGAA